MLLKTSHCDIPYLLFINKLERLLKKSGIVPSQSLNSASTGPKKNKSEAVPNEQPVIGRVIIYIKEHLEEQLSLEELAEEARLSKYQLIRRFREKQGTTPWKYLINQRIKKVKHLLEDGVPPGQAAVEAGFYDQPHLHKTFREEMGLTPREYQEQHFKRRN